MITAVNGSPAPKCSRSIQRCSTERPILLLRPFSYHLSLITLTNSTHSRIITLTLLTVKPKTLTN
nr:MAG TPA: hypothetical protein [Caudoviricetes sp.]